MFELTEYFIRITHVCVIYLKNKKNLKIKLGFIKEFSIFLALKYKSRSLISKYQLNF